MRATGKAFLLAMFLVPPALVPPVPGDPMPAPATHRTYLPFTAGEELVYEVSWWVVHLGTIRIRVLDTGHDSAGARTRARADIDSYAELPFANLHVMTETVMDSECNSRSFLGITQNDRSWRTIRYDYSREKRLLYIERGTAPDRESRQFSAGKVESLSVDPDYQDGLSILYFARANLRSGRQMRVPTIVEGARGTTAFDFHGERNGEEIDAVEYPVDVIGFRGVAEFSGIFGLTGEFEGWFSNDDARVPVRATLEVVLGSVNVELTGWRREGWNPPKYPEK